MQVLHLATSAVLPNFLMLSHKPPCESREHHAVWLWLWTGLNSHSVPLCFVQNSNFIWPKRRKWSGINLVHEAKILGFLVSGKSELSHLSAAEPIFSVLHTRVLLNPALSLRQIKWDEGTPPQCKTIGTHAIPDTYSCSYSVWDSVNQERNLSQMAIQSLPYCKL